MFVIFAARISSKSRETGVKGVSGVNGKPRALKIGGSSSFPSLEL